MITEESIGLTSRLTVPTDDEVLAITAAPQAPEVGRVPSNVPQEYVQRLNRALERSYGGGYDMSQIGEPEPFEGALLLDHIREILLHWARWPDEHSLVIATLWIAHTWFVNNDGMLLFASTPRLIIVAPTNNGKSRIGHLIAGLSRLSELLSGANSAYGLRDALADHETVILDEFHKLVGMTGQRRQDLLSYVLAYTELDGKSRNGRRDGANKTHSYAPLAILTQPVLENPAFEDVVNRSFVIRPQAPPRVNGKPAQIPKLDAAWYNASKSSSEGLYLWGAAECVDQERLWNIHSMSDRLDSRQWELAMPLCAVADRAPDFRYPEDGTDDEDEADRELRLRMRLRWSIAAREATSAKLLGTADSTNVMARIKASMEELKGTS